MGGTGTPRAPPGALTAPCPRSLPRPSPGDPPMLGDTHFAMGGFKALPRVTPRLTPQGWGPQPPGSNPMSCEVTCPKSPGMASEDRGPQHLWWWWGVSSCASAPPIHPPICCQIPATLGRAADNPWQGLARHQGGRRKEQPPTAASGSRALTRPHSWHCRHRSPGPCVQGLSVPSRQTPTQAWLLLLVGGVVPTWAAGRGLTLGCRSPSTGDRGQACLAV